MCLMIWQQTSIKGLLVNHIQETTSNWMGYKYNLNSPKTILKKDLCSPWVIPLLKVVLGSKLRFFWNQTQVSIMGFYLLYRDVERVREAKRPSIKQCFLGLKFRHFERNMLTFPSFFSCKSNQWTLNKL